jgi:hypothetical protein
VNVKRYEMDVVDSTKNMFCWGVCYNPIYAHDQPLWVSDDVVNMDPDSVYEAFHAYYRPNGHEGVSWFPLHLVFYQRPERQYLGRRLLQHGYRDRRELQKMDPLVGLPEPQHGGHRHIGAWSYRIRRFLHGSGQ